MKTINSLVFKDLGIQALSFEELLEIDAGNSLAWYAGYMVGATARAVHDIAEGFMDNIF